jgi:hypothetical protein
MEVEVFRISPTPGNTYMTATYTRRTGIWPNEQFYTTNPLKYVGKHLRHEKAGYGDNANHWDVFEGGVVEYTYEGTTCFKEVKTQTKSS